jgi:hypothetical protein
MPNVLIRGVPENELDELKAAAAAEDMSLQTYLLEAVHRQVVHLRRQAVLARSADRLADAEPVTEAERQAVLEAIERDHAERAERTSGGDF